MSDDLQRARQHWEQQIEHMLTRPAMWSRSTEAFEASMRVAFSAWEVISWPSGRSSLTFVWRRVIEETYRKHNEHYDGQVAYFAAMELKLNLSELADCLRIVWDRLRDPIERLASVGGED